jgi:uncharacterized protein (TIGR03067 family)
MRIVTSVLASIVLAGSAAAQDVTKMEMAKLEGEWSMVSGESSGFSLPEDTVKTGKRVCKDGETTITMSGKVYFKAEVTIDPAKKPKAIDYEMTEGPTKGKTHLGIYELDGDTVKFCFAAPARADRRTSRPRRAATGPSASGSESRSNCRDLHRQWMRLASSTGSRSVGWSRVSSLVSRPSSQPVTYWLPSKGSPFSP